jgi:hypothetical protein
MGARQEDLWDGRPGAIQTPGPKVSEIFAGISGNGWIQPVRSSSSAKCLVLLRMPYDPVIWYHKVRY